MVQHVGYARRSFAGFAVFATLYRPRARKTKGLRTRENVLLQS
jgi:hypothetical protein